MGNKLSRLEMIYLLFWVIMGTGIIAIPFSIGQFTVRDGWISTTMVLVTLPIVMMIGYMYQRSFPNTNLVQSFYAVFGRVGGSIMALWYLICLYVTVTTIWRELTVYMETTVYPKTPGVVLAAVLVIPISYGVYKGIVSIGLFSEFLAPLAGAVVLIVTLLSVQNLHFEPMTPVLVDGWTPALRGAMVPGVTYALEPLVCLQFLKEISNPKTLFWDLGISLFLVFVFLFVIEVVTVGILGQATGELRYPVLEVVRTISVAHFIERLDTLYGMGLLATIYVKISIFHYAFCRTLEDIFKLSSHKAVVWTSSLFIWAGSTFFFVDSYSVGEFIIFTTPAYFIVTFAAMPIITIVGQRLRKPKSNRKRIAPT